MADTLQGHCSVNIASRFPLLEVDMIIENTSGVFTKIERKNYTCLFRADVMDAFALLVKDVVNKYGKHLEAQFVQVYLYLQKNIFHKVNHQI